MDSHEETEEDWGDPTFELFFGVMDKISKGDHASRSFSEASGSLNIPEREVRILCWRYNRDGTFKRTLQDISNEEGVTRERIRQIAAKALRRLRQPTKQEALRDFLKEEEGI